jgi:hypothetical protein
MAIIPLHGATRYDAQKANTNSSYDREAYDSVHRGFRRLLGWEELAVVMELAIEVMQWGSEQASMSDEAMISEAFENRLAVVIDAVGPSSLAVDGIVRRCDEMRIAHAGTAKAVSCPVRNALPDRVAVVEAEELWEAKRVLRDGHSMTTSCRPCQSR